MFALALHRLPFPVVSVCFVQVTWGMAHNAVKVCVEDEKYEELIGTRLLQFAVADGDKTCDFPVYSTVQCDLRSFAMMPSS